jgi:hypothetical protein
MSVLGTTVYPRSHLCKSLIYVQLGFHLVNNYRASTVDGRVDSNEQGIKPKTYRGYRKQVFQKTTKDLEQIQDPQSSLTNAINVIPR